MAVIAGLDGCRSGWLCVVLNLMTSDSVATVLPQICNVLSLSPFPDVLAVDIPIGLTQAGPRQCDIEARAKLKAPRASSVFPAPVRPVLEATNYSDACNLGLKADGRKLSCQTWNILGKIREMDIFLRSDITRQERVREVHPEMSFWAWNGEKAMANRKKSKAGKAEREALVMQRYGAVYTNAKRNLPSGQYSYDDLLDALAALWTAERIHTRTALTLPSNPPMDSHGLRMEILA